MPDYEINISFKHYLSLIIDIKCKMDIKTGPIKLSRNQSKIVLSYIQYLTPRTVFFLLVIIIFINQDK